MPNIFDMARSSWTFPLKNWTSLLIFKFGIPGAKISVVSIRKGFKLRFESYQEASHALEEVLFHCLRLYSLLPSFAIFFSDNYKEKVNGPLTTVPQPF